MSANISEIGNQLRQAAAERIDCGAPQVVPTMSPGQGFAQGDVGIIMLDALPQSARKIGAPQGRQIAPGNTKGSRHIVDAANEVKFFRVDDGDMLSDLALDATASGFTLRHPEHADVTFPSGIYRIVHQQNEKRERVLD